MKKWNPTLLENGELQLDKTIEVPETLTFELWRAALAEKIQGTNLTLADMVEGLTQKDCQDLGIPWPESPYDRSYEINQNLYELLIRTLWNGIIKQIKKDKIK